ncbi:DDE-type integrase/transposase/recombinase [Altererythrobacter arenosus]|uniref:DDE-type integrase/transposase/recombinase n=1 Tax=Altererythrobacter arenosus TaxID=3032592 RepID=UPI003D321EC3
MFAADVRSHRGSRMRSVRLWRRHLDEIGVQLLGETAHLLRAVDHEGEVLSNLTSRKREKSAALAFM